MLIAPILALALLGMPKQAILAVTVDVKDGEVISQERKFRASVQSDHPVTKVEFTVGANLRDSDSSTPYEFTIDPLNEEEGDVKLTFAAYNVEGQSGKKTVTVKIDNGVSKGADFHVERAEKLLTDQKWDEAILAGRIALKAKPGYNPARNVLARAFFGKGILDRAQQFAEDVVAADPNDQQAVELLAGISLQRAFNMFSGSSGNREDTLKAISESITSAVKNRKKNLDARFEKIGPVTDANRLQYADAAMAAGRYSQAVSALQAQFQQNPANAAIANRLIYAHLRGGRVGEAASALALMKRQNALDAYGYALYAIVEADQGNTAKSDEYMKEAVSGDANSLGVRTAQAYIALRRGNNASFRQLAQSLQQEVGVRPEVNYYLTILYNLLGEYGESDKRFQQAVLAEPANYDLYIERGNQAILPVVSRRITSPSDVAFQYKVAEAFYNAALAAKPDSAESLVALTLMRLHQGRIADAVSFAEGAQRAAPEYAPAQYTAAAVFGSGQQAYNNRADDIRKNDADGNLDQSQRDEIAKLKSEASRLEQAARAARSKAEVLDPAALKGRPFPLFADAFDYFYKSGRIAFLAPPK